MFPLWCPKPLGIKIPTAIRSGKTEICATNGKGGNVHTQFNEVIVEHED